MRQIDMEFPNRRIVYLKRELAYEIPKALSYNYTFHSGMIKEPTTIFVRTKSRRGYDRFYCFVAHETGDYHQRYVVFKVIGIGNGLSTEILGDARRRPIVAKYFEPYVMELYL